MSIPSDPNQIPADLIENLTVEIRSRERIYGLNHPYLAESLNSLALVYHHMLNNSKLALRYHQQALKVLTIAREEGSSDIDREELTIRLAVTTSDIANAHWALHNDKAAKDTFVRALALLEEEKIPENHPRAYAIINRLSALHRHSTELDLPKKLCVESSQSAFPSMSEYSFLPSLPIISTCANDPNHDADKVEIIFSSKQGGRRAKDDQSESFTAKRRRTIEDLSSATAACTRPQLVEKEVTNNK